MFGIQLPFLNSQLVLHQFCMKVHTNINNLPVFTNAVITTGTFDGVHRGHQQIIQQLKEEARAVGGETVIVTFHPHPRMVLATSKQPIGLLNTLAEKEELMRRYGIDHLVIVPFTGFFSELEAADYIKDFLVGKFHPHTIVTGYDHKFGHHRQGNYQMLEEYATRHGFTVKEIPARVLEHSAVSSTRIRKSLLQGNCIMANELLGYEYFFSGKVVEGNKLGRTIGYPTANLAIEDPHKLIPGNGVYAVKVNLGHAAVYRGMMNIGTRPTVDGTKQVIEVNIFDFEGDIYGETITIALHKHLRSEVKFSGIEALKAQLVKDKEAASGNV
jgi:riboflavin kinase / FMN adenylyltransferase